MGAQPSLGRVRSLPKPCHSSHLRTLRHPAPPFHHVPARPGCCRLREARRFDTRGGDDCCHRKSMNIPPFFLTHTINKKLGFSTMAMLVYKTIKLFEGWKDGNIHIFELNFEHKSKFLKGFVLKYLWLMEFSKLHNLTIQERWAMSNNFKPPPKWSTLNPAPNPVRIPPNKAFHRRPPGSKWFWKLFQVNRSFRTLSSPHVLPKNRFVTKTSILSWSPKFAMQKKIKNSPYPQKIYWTHFWWKIQHLFRDVETTPYSQLDHRCFREFGNPKHPRWNRVVDRCLNWMLPLQYMNNGC